MRTLDTLDVLYGVAMILISVVFIILYIPVILAFSTKADSTVATFTFRLMIFHNVSDILQLVCHLATGAALLIGFYEDHIIFRVLGAFLGASWFLMLFLTVTLTTHRLFLVVFERVSIFLLRPVVSWGVVFVNCAVWLVVFALNLSPYAGSHYDFTFHFWTWDAGKPLSGVFEFLETYLMLASCVISLLMYLVIFAYIYWRHQKNLHRNEQRIALQMFSYCLFTLFVCLTWDFGEDVIPRIPFIRFIIDLLWPLWNGANAILYLVFNRTLLRSSLQTLKVKVKNSSHNMISAT